MRRKVTLLMWPTCTLCYLQIHSRSVPGSWPNNMEPGKCVLTCTGNQDPAPHIRANTLGFEVSRESLVPHALLH